MSSLTEEQRRRMEENRRKALERRAMAEAAAAAQNQNQNQPVVTPQPQLRPPPAKQPFVETSNRPSSAPSNIVFKAPPAPPPTAAPFTGKVLTGNCILVSNTRFKVSIGYNPQVISIFKSIEGAAYDAPTKTWNFPLTQHSKLISAVDTLRPAVLVCQLPSFVLRVFRNAAAQPKVEPNLEGRVDPELLRRLLPFQKTGIITGIQRNGRILIADDMGLGKTIQALGIVHYYYQDWPLLIVSPSSMRYRWREAISEWLPSVSLATIVVAESGRDTFANAKVVIMSYDLLQKKGEELTKFKCVIMDESHHLKNYKAARTKVAVPILQEARRAILLSGTPALSRPIELYPQISAINRNLVTYNDYGVRYCAGKKNAWGWDFSGSSNMEELNLLLAESVMIRRLKSEVLKQLPPKIRKLVILDPNLVKLESKTLKQSATAFLVAKESKISEAEKRSKMLEYYSITAHAKLPAITAYLRDLIDSGRKFIVFAHHKVMLDGICDDLDTLNCKYIRIDGQTSSEDRQHSVDAFQSREDVRVAVLSIMAANSGITLTAAGLVCFAEMSWNPGILTQAEDRAHRIGQEDSVLVEYLLAKGTADDVLWPMVQEKLNTLNKAGLSKDNFMDATATAAPTTATKPDSTNPPITAYFQKKAEEELSQEDLMQIFEESFD